MVPHLLLQHGTDCCSGLEVLVFKLAELGVKQASTGYLAKPLSPVLASTLRVLAVAFMRWSLARG